jgi:hypothetical protein
MIVTDTVLTDMIITYNFIGFGKLHPMEGESPSVFSRMREAVGQFDHRADILCSETVLDWWLGFFRGGGYHH